ncbi:hypothetical protein J2T25_000716 [Citrobacter amalonaticus]|uniref:DUF6506 family protein n=1 Tax=Citrobacter amalonaticus TaxID=35703 RepID=UPI00209DA9FE|nr:DUF6506 family protein [Citrobacter amalonaticus]MCP1627804.1 hypothetical protein [Citrobacter amalonaticus]
MSDMLKAAFIFVAPHSVAETHNAWVKTEQVQVKTIAVSDYQQAGKLLDALYDEGIRAIELCAGFGHLGVAHMVNAAAGRMHVGVVRFDLHPGLGNRSGDSLFE